MKNNCKVLLIAINLTMAICFMFSSCKKCPPNIKLGDVRMKNPAFFPLKGGENLTFKNSKKETIILVDSSEKSYENKIIIESLCNNAPFSTQFSYYTGTPSYNLRYVNSKENIKLYFDFKTSNTQTQKDSLLYDFLSINFSYKDVKIASNNLYILVSDRGNSANLPSTFKNRSIHVSDSLINAVNYKKVFYDPANKKLIYAEKLGLVAFWFKNDWWYLSN